jgi:ATP-dependent helicase/nuclease subunit B
MVVRMPADAPSITSLTLTPLVTLGFSGSSFTEHDEIPMDGAVLGRPVWGPPALLANLELRLGLAVPRVGAAVRMQQWARELERHGTTRRFYSASYETDRLGTAAMLLAMRDELVMAGWNGSPVDSGGDRLATFALIEAGFECPPGDGDRLRLVEDELFTTHARPFDAIVLAEPVDAWPGRWRRVFALLAQNGVRVEPRCVSLQPIEGASDLAVIQRLLSDQGATSGVRGDGSFVILRGETSWEVATAVAAFLGVIAKEQIVVVRGGDVAALDGALVAHGLGSQGLTSPSDWRPIHQVLPLAIELAFEPRDPYRVLELLTLPGGPFDNYIGGSLARALERGPGIGGRPWRKAKEFIVSKAIDGSSEGESRASEILSKIEEWFEQCGSPADGATRDALLDVTRRVVGWLRVAYVRARGGSEHAASLLGAALAEAQSFEEALSHDTRDALDLVDARLLLEHVREGHSLDLSEETAGRIQAADSPTLLRARCDTVVWWHCVSGTEWRMYPRAWRIEELEALRAAGVSLADPKARLRSEAAAWRSTITTARRRVVLVTPQSAMGEQLEAHPIVDEIAARLGPGELSRIIVDARSLARDGHWPGVPAIPIALNPSSALPSAGTEWRVAPGSIPRSAEYSATSLEELLGCPLRSVLARATKLRGGSLAAIPSGHLLYGKLAHRVVEELHRLDALTHPHAINPVFDEVFDTLVRQEAAVLTRPGMTFELAQLRHQLQRSVGQLASLLASARLRVIGVESPVRCEWRGGNLEGDVDLLLADENDRELVLDLKWGAKAYRERLETGRSIQLAAYVHARGRTSVQPRGAYFSLKQGRLLATEPISAEHRVVEGPSLGSTWSKLERTLDVVESAMAAGRIPVTGVSRSLPLLSALGVPKDDDDQHLNQAPEGGCAYCAFDAVCGKRWEVLS